MRRGNTETITITPPDGADLGSVDSTRIRAVVFQPGFYHVEKENSDVTVGASNFSITLTQAETLGFCGYCNQKVFKQVKWADTSGNVYQTRAWEEPLFDTGSEETI